MRFLHFIFILNAALIKIMIKQQGQFDLRSLALLKIMMIHPKTSRSELVSESVTNGHALIIEKLSLLFMTNYEK